VCTRVRIELEFGSELIQLAVYDDAIDQHRPTSVEATLHGILDPVRGTFEIAPRRRGTVAKAAVTNTLSTARVGGRP
jgi:hypothetical protein